MAHDGQVSSPATTSVISQQIQEIQKVSNNNNWGPCHGRSRKPFLVDCPRWLARYIGTMVMIIIIFASLFFCNCKVLILNQICLVNILIIRAWTCLNCNRSNGSTYSSNYHEYLPLFICTILPVRTTTIRTGVHEYGLSGDATQRILRPARHSCQREREGNSPNLSVLL